MTVEYRVGDLFEQSDDVVAIGHGVNCRGVMGAGIATAFKRKYPDMYEQYRRRCAWDAMLPGEIMEWVTDDGLFIFNMASQIEPGANALDYLLFSSLLKAMHRCREYNIPSLAVPRIGAGIGGLTWPQVKLIFELVDKREKWVLPKVQLIVVTTPEQAELEAGEL